MKPPTPLRGGNQATTNTLTLVQFALIREHTLSSPSHPLIDKGVYRLDRRLIIC